MPLEVEPEQIATFLGSRVHESLEHLYQRLSRGRLLLLEDLLAHYRQVWQDNWTQDVVMHDGANPADHCAVGELCLRDYYARHQPFDQTRTVGLEKLISFPLDEAGRHRLQGYIDRLSCTRDNNWQIHDYKTNSRLPTQQDKDSDPQLAFYEIGIRQMWKGIQRVELVWHFLRFDQTIISTRTAEQLIELKVKTVETIQDIESRNTAEAAFPTKESGLCNYCEYQAVCPVRKHLVKVRALPENKFLREPGVQLVDEWTKLKAKQDALTDQINEIQVTIDQIRTALLALAAKEGLETVAGRDNQVAIRHSQRTLFPRKGLEPEEAAELEARLRDSEWWPDVSALDRNALTRLWNDPDVMDERLKTLLAKYVWTEDETTLRLRGRKA